MSPAYATRMQELSQRYLQLVIFRRRLAAKLQTLLHGAAE